MENLTERYASQIAGVLSCFDRVVITGTLPDICYAGAVTRLLYERDIRIFDYTKQFAEPLRELIRSNAEQVAASCGVEIEFVPSTKSFRKESRVQEVLAQHPPQERDQPGLVHIFSAMESCNAFQPWHDKTTHKTFLRATSGKCLHYYFYFIDAQFGLCYLRVPTWAPFRLQFYCNGHNWLARQLEQEGIAFKQLDNSFLEIADWQRAQQLADQFNAKALHRVMDKAASQYCPVVKEFNSGYHWSLMQTEYATDITFKKQEELYPIYNNISRTAVVSVKPENVATFLGRKLHPNFQDELGNNFNTRIEGTRIKHQMGPSFIKMYDKGGIVLRIETTTNDVTFFKHYREVEHRDGRKEKKLAPLRKSIYSLGVLRELLGAANRRYLEFVSNLDDPTVGMRKVEKLSQTVRCNDRPSRGFNLFNSDDLELLLALMQGQWNISGLQNSTLRLLMEGKTGPQISNLLKRLRLHGIIKKIGHTYKYYLTKFGKQVVTMALKLREMVVIPEMAKNFA